MRKVICNCHGAELGSIKCRINDVWPPRPDLPDPLTEYDEFVKALLAAEEPVRSRLSLVKLLREETGLGLRECLAIANNYCTRNSVVFRE